MCASITGPVAYSIFGHLWCFSVCSATAAAVRSLGVEAGTFFAFLGLRIWDAAMPAVQAGQYMYALCGCACT